MEKKLLLSLLPLLLPFCIQAQPASWLTELLKYRAEKDEEFRNEETTPLPKEDLSDFQGLSYFPPDTAYYVIARMELTPGDSAFEMATSTGRKPLYRRYGILHFTLGDSSYTLNVYQGLEIIKRPGLEDYLFLPFGDFTNGVETYGGGRYLDFRIPLNPDSVIVDFNRAYNPYCAYNYRYSCPLIPEGNKLQLAILAGEMVY